MHDCVHMWCEWLHDWIVVLFDVVSVPLYSNRRWDRALHRDWSTWWSVPRHCRQASLKGSLDVSSVITVSWGVIGLYELVVWLRNYFWLAWLGDSRNWILACRTWNNSMSLSQSNLGLNELAMWVSKHLFSGSNGERIWDPMKAVNHGC